MKYLQNYRQKNKQIQMQDYLTQDTDVHFLHIKKICGHCCCSFNIHAFSPGQRTWLSLFFHILEFYNKIIKEVVNKGHPLPRQMSNDE